MKIAGLQRVTLIDFPNRIAASVFLAGCNLNCGYCHNRWMINAADVVPAQSVDEFFEWLEHRVGLLDGVCVSGGEPTIHRELPGFLRAIRDLGFEIKLDTNGTLPDRLRYLLDEKLVDYVAMDIKAPLDTRYSQVAGRSVDVNAIRTSMSLLRDRLADYEFRTTVEPSLDPSALRDMAQLMEPGDRWYLQIFEPAPGVTLELDEATWPDKEELIQIAKDLQSLTSAVRVRGEMTQVAG